jgi:penicillin-binding protein 1A
MALPIWGYYMNKVYDDPNLKISTKDFEMPAQYDNSIFNCSRADETPDFM